MSLIETLTAWDQAVHCYDSGLFSEALGKLNEITDPSSKILFNMACVQQRRGYNDESLKHLDACVKKDQHLAIGFFQRGIVLYHMERYEESLQSFEQCMACLRGKDVIDYKQLGLCHKLYGCEVLQNKAVLSCKFHDFAGAVDCLLKAEKCQAEPKHSHENRSLESLQAGHLIKLVELPKSAIFKPAKSKTSNIGKKNYLGTAKVISSVKENDDFSGFMGPQKIEEDKLKSKSAPSSPQMARLGSPISSSTFLSSSLNYIKDSLSPSPPRKNSAPNPSSHSGSSDDHQMSPVKILASQIAEMSIPKINITPPRENPADKPPPPRRPVPRLQGSKVNNGVTLGKENSQSVIEEVIRKTKAENGHNTSQSVTPPKRSPPVPEKRSNSNHKAESNHSSLDNVSTSNNNRYTAPSRAIPPPPSKPLPVPPVPSRALRKQRLDPPISNNNNNDDPPYLPPRSTNHTSSSVPELQQGSLDGDSLDFTSFDIKPNISLGSNFSKNDLTDDVTANDYATINIPSESKMVNLKNSNIDKFGVNVNVGDVLQLQRDVLAEEKRRKSLESEKLLLEIELLKRQIMYSDLSQMNFNPSQICNSNCNIIGGVSSCGYADQKPNYFYV